MMSPATIRCVNSLTASAGAAFGNRTKNQAAIEVAPRPSRANISCGLNWMSVRERTSLLANVYPHRHLGNGQEAEQARCPASAALFPAALLAGERVGDGVHRRPEHDDEHRREDQEDEREQDLDRGLLRPLLR